MVELVFMGHWPVLPCPIVALWDKIQYLKRFRPTPQLAFQYSYRLCPATLK